MRLPEGSFTRPLGAYIDLMAEPAAQISVGDLPHYSQAFRPARPGDFQLDFNQGDYWLRFAIANDSDVERHAILRLRPSHIKQATLYRHGSLAPIAPVDNENLVRKPRLFNLTLPAASQTLYYLKLSSEGQVLTTLELSDMKPFLQAYRMELFSNGAGLGALLILAVSNLVLSVCFPRVRLFLLLGLYASCNMLTIAAAWGYFALTDRAVTPFENPAFMSLTHLSMVLAIYIAGEFQARSPDGRQRWHPLIQSLVLLNGGAALLAPLTSTTVSLWTMLLLISTSAIIISLRPLLTYLLTRDQVSFQYLFTRVWIIFFVTLAALLYHYERASFEIINVLLLLGTAFEILLLSVISAIHRQHWLETRHSNQLEGTALAAELRGGNEMHRQLKKALLTPLSTVFGVTEMLKHSGLSRHQRDFLQNLENASRELWHTLKTPPACKTVAEIARAKADRVFDLPQLLSESLAEQGDQRRHITLQKAAQLPRQLLGDPAQLRQLLTQLLSFCLAAAKDSSLTATIDWRSTNLTLGLTYRGAEAIALRRAWQRRPDQHPDASEAQTQVIAQLLHQLNAAVRFSSVADKQHLAVELPVTIWTYPPVIPQRVYLKSRRILIVEPDVTLALQYKHYCESWGMIAFVARNQSQALAVYQSQRLLDVSVDVLLLGDDQVLSCQSIDKATSATGLSTLPRIYLTDKDGAAPEVAPTPYRVLSRPVASFTLKRLIMELLSEQPATVESTT